MASSYLVGDFDEERKDDDYKQVVNDADRSYDDVRDLQRHVANVRQIQVHQTTTYHAERFLAAHEDGIVPAFIHVTSSASVIAVYRFVTQKYSFTHVTLMNIPATTTTTTTTHTHNRFTALLQYVRYHPGEQVPER